MWEPSERYPDPAVRVLDPAFNQYRLMLASVERLYTGCRWSEGPVWFGDGRYLLWSDIPNNRILRWDEETGAVSVFRKPSNNANGNTRDRQGRLVTCEHRRPARHAHRARRRHHRAGGLVQRPEAQFSERRRRRAGWRDLVHRSALRHPRATTRATRTSRRTRRPVYRLDGQTGQLAVMADDIAGPNGLAFSPDETDALRGRVARDAASHDPRLRRDRRRREARPRAGC